MTDYKYGDIVLVKFPFTNLQTTKQRPAVILSTTEYNEQRQDYILMAISSRIRTPLQMGEALIEDWEDAGLILSSVFKPLVSTLEQDLIIKKLGHISFRDKEALNNIITKIIGE